MDVRRGGGLRPHSAHALSCGSIASCGFTLAYQDVFAAGGDQVVGDAGAYDPSTDDDDFRGLHVQGF
jgi:hypothetical protein